MAQVMAQVIGQVHDGEFDGKCETYRDIQPAHLKHIENPKNSHTREGSAKQPGCQNKHNQHKHGISASDTGGNSLQHGG